MKRTPHRGSLPRVKTQLGRLLAALPWLALPLGAQSETTVQLSDTVLLSDVVPLGIHLSGDNYYESNIKKARIEENFEGTLLRTVGRVTVLASNKVKMSDSIDGTLADAYIALGAKYQILAGPNAFQTGNVLSISKVDISTKTDGTSNCKLELTLDKNFTPADKENGIWIDALANNQGYTSYGTYSAQTFSINSSMITGDAKFAYGEGFTRFGQNALELNGTSAAAAYKFYVAESDDMNIQATWKVRLRYRAKSGTPTLRVDFGSGTNNSVTNVSTSWTQYDQNLVYAPTTVPKRLIVTVQATGGSILIDDVEILTVGDTNPTAFRDEYVNMLKELRPGTARYLVNRTDRLEHRLTRKLDAYAVRCNSKPDKIDFGMHEFYDLAAHVGFNPWYTLPGSLTKEDMLGLMEYLAAPSNVGWGAKRAAAGRTAPWTDSLNKIYLQFGNEWITFPGTGFNGAGYWEGLIAAAKASPYYNSKIKFVTDVQGGATYNLTNAPSSDMGCMNSYVMFGVYTPMISAYDTPQKLATYLLANPWHYWTAIHDSSDKARDIVAAGKEPSIYEGGNFHTTFGDVPVDTINNMLTSHVGGVVGVHQMLLMMKLFGARAQNSFNLTQLTFSPGGSFGDIPGDVRLWGGLLDQRDASRRYRPRLLALRAANQVIGGDLIETVQGGSDNTANITVDGVFSPAYSYRKDGLAGVVQMKRIASYGFKQGNRRGLILINQDTSNNRTVRIQFSGTVTGSTASFWRVAPDDLFADNEPEQTTPQVVLETGSLASFASGSTVSLKPGAFMSLSWNVSATSNTAPAFTTQPVSASVQSGGDHTFSVVVTGTPTPTLQWYKDNTAITGATGTSYTITGVTASSAGTYKVVATNSVTSTTSNDAVLTVTAANSAPAFTTQPVSVSKAVGSSHTFTVAVTGTPTPTLQWRKNGTNISGATGTSYTLSNIVAGDAGTYSVVATNSVSATNSNDAVLTVTTAGTPVIIENDTTGKVSFSGAWYSVSLTGTASGGTIHTVANNASASATVTPGLAGTYDIEVFQPAWSRSSTGASFTVNHSGGSSPFTVNQTANAGLWVKLGSGSFTLTTASTIVLNGAVVQDSDTTEERPILDAIRLTPATPPPSGPVYEAEAYTNTTGVSPWAKVTDATASGGFYMATAEGSGNSTAAVPSTGYLDFTYTQAVAGPVYVYVRVYETSTSANGSDSLWIDFLNDSTAAASWTTFNVNNAWTWFEWTTGKPATLPAGTHTLRIYYREDGFRIDRVAISPTPLTTSSL